MFCRQVLPAVADDHWAPSNGNSGLIAARTEPACGAQPACGSHEAGMAHEAAVYPVYPVASREAGGKLELVGSPAARGGRQASRPRMFPVLFLLGFRVKEWLEQEAPGWDILHPWQKLSIPVANGSVGSCQAEGRRGAGWLGCPHSLVMSVCLLRKPSPGWSQGSTWASTQPRRAKCATTTIALMKTA
jgi:hypothetical protein